MFGKQALVITVTEMLSGFQEAFSCCFFNSQFSLCTDISYLMPCTGTRQKEIKQRISKTKETVVSDTRRELRLTSTLPLRQPELRWASRTHLIMQNPLCVPQTSPDGPDRGRTARVLTDSTGEGKGQAHPLPAPMGGRLLRPVPHPPPPGVLNVLASQIPCKRKTQK